LSGALRLDKQTNAKHNLLVRFASVNVTRQDVVAEARAACVIDVKKRVLHLYFFHVFAF